MVDRFGIALVELYAPGEVQSWDVTKLKSPHRGVYYDLSVMLDN